MNAVAQDLISSERIHSAPIGSDTGETTIARLTRALRQWSERAVQRRQLSSLTQRELDDIGISMEAAAAEAAKPFWRA
jgi:uncharacterized protein YjiS (DUF1127 family)